MWGRGVKICRFFRVCFNLNDHQFKTSRYSYRSAYTNPMIKSNIYNRHTQNKKEHKHATKEKYQSTREEMKSEELQSQWKHK